MEKKMIMTAVDQYYSFDELEEHIREGAIYDVMSELDINEEEAIKILQESSFRYTAIVEYNI